MAAAPDHFESSQRILQTPRFDVYRVKVPSRSGRILERDACVPPDAVVILPLLDDQSVVLIRNERFAVGRTLWELPAGTIEPGEPPEDCAARELIEETGYRAARVDPLTTFYHSPGLCTEKMYAFVGRDLAHVGQHLDENERITVEVIPLDKTMDMVRDHTIGDGKTIAALLYYGRFGAPQD